MCSKDIPTEFKSSMDLKLEQNSTFTVHKFNLSSLKMQEEQKAMLEEERRKREDFERTQQEKEKQLRGF